MQCRGVIGGDTYLGGCRRWGTSLKVCGKKSVEKTKLVFFVRTITNLRSHMRIFVVDYLQIQQRV